MNDDIGEVCASVSIDNGDMVIMLSEKERMRLIRKLAGAHVDEYGKLEVFFKIGEKEYNNYDSGEEGLSQEVPKEAITEEEPENIEQLDSFRSYIAEEEVTEDFDMVDDESYVSAGRRSIDDLEDRDKEFLVSQYIKDIPTTVIMEAESVTKSALYSSLERERIPRKGKLNNIIRRLEDGESPMNVGQDEDVDMKVMYRIIKTLGNQ